MDLCVLKIRRTDLLDEGVRFEQMNNRRKADRPVDC